LEDDMSTSLLKSTRRLALVIGFVAITSPAVASTRVAVYAIIDEVELEPSRLEPDRIWISGAFVVPTPVSSGLHEPAVRGHLYLILDPADAASTRRDWEALAASAGTGRAVGFGEYWMPCSRSRARVAFPADANCSSEITVVETDRTRATPELYPKPSSEGVVTAFESSDDVCPRFGRPSGEIIAALRHVHSPGSAREELPVCEASVGLVAVSDLDSAFVEQTRNAEWAPATEALIMQRFADAPGLRLSAVRVECRDTICHIHAAFPSSDYQQATGNRLVANALEDLPGFTSSSAKIVPGEDTPTIDYYVQRRQAP
jgi:hypothetical protein